MKGTLFYWVANWSLSRAQAASRLGGNVADMVDCTHSALPRVKSTSIRRFGAYVTGTPDIRWTPADFEEISSLHAATAILRIDQSDLNLPLLADAKEAKDVEGGASTVGEAAIVAQERISAGDDFTIYLSESVLPAMEQMIARVHLAPGKIAAIQYASPTSNPGTPLPGTGLNLKQANADLSVVLPSWLPLPNTKPVPPPTDVTDRVRLEVVVAYDPDDGQWHSESTTFHPLSHGTTKP